MFIYSTSWHHLHKNWFTCQMDGAEFKYEVENSVNCYDVASLMPRQRCWRYVMTYFIIYFSWHRKLKAHHLFTLVVNLHYSSFITLETFEIWILYICYNGRCYCDAAMVAEIYPTLPPICCYLNMFKRKNWLFSFLN